MRIVHVLLAVSLPIQAGQVAASHLSEEEVLDMERRCDQLREEKLAPERKALFKQCVDAGELARAECVQKAAEYGEQQAAPIRRPGKYYDLPECQEAYRARKHYDLNPGR